MLMMGLNETMDQLAMASCVDWYGDRLRMEDGHVSNMTLDIEEGQRKNERPMRTWKKRVGEESMKVDLRREDALCGQMWIVDINMIAKRLR